MRRLLLHLAVLLATGAPVACGGTAKKPDAMAAPPPDVRPLAGFAAQRVAVLPAQRVRPADSVAWGAHADSRAYLGVLDSAFAAELTARGMASVWALPGDVVRAAKRNAAYAADPHSLAVNPLIPRRSSTPPDITDPLASQLRTLVALVDARYALVPVELRFEKGAGAGRAVLRVAFIDARAAQVAWTGDVPGDTASVLSPALAAAAAARVADLIAAP